MIPSTSRFPLACRKPVSVTTSPVAGGVAAASGEVDPRHDRHAAAGDAEVERDRGAELERDLDQLDAVGAEPDAEEAAPGEQA